MKQPGGSASQASSGSKMNDSGTPNSGSYTTTFAGRDMKVNKMYAKYLERFGNSSAEAGVAPLKQSDELNLRVQSSSEQRREEDKKDSLSPEMDCMMESTGM